MEGLTMWYATREQVKEALDARTAVRQDAAVDRALEAASRRVERLLRRTPGPTQATRTLDYPQRDVPPGTLELDEWLISLTSVTSGGAALTVSDLLLYPTSGPPYTRIECDDDSSTMFETGATDQQNVSVTGLWGYDSEVVPVGTLVEALDDSETGVDASDASLIGVGDVLKVGTEWMTVAGREWLSTGQTSTLALLASMTGNSITVASGAALHAGEVITVDTERMFIESITGNVLAVRRAYDGTVLATHAGGAGIHAARTLTVARGTSPTTHLNGAAVNRWLVPGPISSLCLAEACSELLSSASGWTRRESEDLERMRREVHAMYAPRCRTVAI
jgi:hypothetical protein